MSIRRCLNEKLKLVILCSAEKAIVEILLGLALFVENWTALLKPLVLELHYLQQTNVICMNGK